MKKQYNENDPYLKTLPYDATYVLKFGYYKLRNCPFCNQKPWTGGITNSISTTWTIECRNCSFSLKYSKYHLGGFESKRHLVNHWNGYKDPISDSCEDSGILGTPCDKDDCNEGCLRS